jgi:hypothetical protein
MKDWGINQNPRLQPCKTARETSPLFELHWKHANAPTIMDANLLAQSFV